MKMVCRETDEVLRIWGGLMHIQPTLWYHHSQVVPVLLLQSVNLIYALKIKNKENNCCLFEIQAPNKSSESNLGKGAYIQIV